MSSPRETFLRLVSGVCDGPYEHLADLYAEQTHVTHPFHPLSPPPLRSRRELHEHFTAPPPVARTLHRKPVDITVTAVLRQLEIDGYAVVEEAATDVIALRQALGTEEPWREPAFIEDIADLQRRRQLSADTDARPVTFFDRSPVCTLALCRHLAVPVSTGLLAELDRMRAARIYEPTVFFVRHQGFVRPTAARRISFEDALVFEQTHEVAYREWGFTLVEVPAAPLQVRAAMIREAVSSASRTRMGR